MGKTRKLNKVSRVKLIIDFNSHILPSVSDWDNEIRKLQFFFFWSLRRPHGHTPYNTNIERSSKFTVALPG